MFKDHSPVMSCSLDFQPSQLVRPQEQRFDWMNVPAETQTEKNHKNMAHGSFYPCFPQAAHTASKAPWHGTARCESAHRRQLIDAWLKRPSHSLLYVYNDKGYSTPSVFEEHKPGVSPYLRINLLPATERRPQTTQGTLCSQTSSSLDPPTHHLRPSDQLSPQRC